MELIRGKVAAIKSEYAIIINKGYEDDVEEDMRFLIYEEGEEIRDPDTKASLGNLELFKAKVKVKIPSEKFSWAETYETDIIPSGLTVVVNPFAPKQVRVKLPLATSILDPQEIIKIVKVGDLVRQIID
jgi:hypothetical protein